MKMDGKVRLWNNFFERFSSTFEFSNAGVMPLIMLDPFGYVVQLVCQVTVRKEKKKEKEYVVCVVVYV